MRTIHVSASKSYDVLIGEGLIDKCGELTAKVVRPCRCVIVSDDTVDELYGDRAQISFRYAGFDATRFAFPAGEANKNLSTLGDILNALGEAGLSRKLAEAAPQVASAVTPTDSPIAQAETTGSIGSGTLGTA